MKILERIDKCNIHQKVVNGFDEAIGYSALQYACDNNMEKVIIKIINYTNNNGDIDEMHGLAMLFDEIEDFTNSRKYYLMALDNYCQATLLELILMKTEYFNGERYNVDEYEIMKYYRIFDKKRLYYGRYKKQI